MDGAGLSRSKSHASPVSQIFVFFPDEQKVGVKTIKTFAERMRNEGVFRAIMVTQVPPPLLPSRVHHCVEWSESVDLMEEPSITLEGIILGLGPKPKHKTIENRAYIVMLIATVVHCLAPAPPSTAVPAVR